MERGLWIGVVIGLILVAVVFSVGFYSGNILTGYVTDEAAQTRGGFFGLLNFGDDNVPENPQICDGISLSLTLGDSINTKVGTFKLEGVGEGKALVSLDGNTEAIDEGEIKAIINGVRVQVLNVFSNDNDETQNRAIIKVCDLKDNQGDNYNQNYNQNNNGSLPACIYTDEADSLMLFAQRGNMTGSDVCNYFNNNYKTIEGKSYVPVAYTLENIKNRFLNASDCISRVVYDFRTYEYITRSADLFGLGKYSPIVFSDGVGVKFGSESCSDEYGSSALQWTRTTGIWCCVADAPLQPIV